MPARPAGSSAMVETSRSPNTVIATVRGIGVAVSTSTCGLAPFSRSASRCSTPKRCCSSTTTSPRSKNATFSPSSACVPTTIDAAPETAASVALRRSAAGSCPVSSVGRRRRRGRARACARSSAGAGRPAPRSARGARTARRTRRPRASPAARRASCRSRPRPARAGSSAPVAARSAAISAPTVRWSPVSANGSAASKSSRSAPRLARRRQGRAQRARCCSSAACSTNASWKRRASRAALPVRVLDSGPVDRARARVRNGIEAAALAHASGTGSSTRAEPVEDDRRSLLRAASSAIVRWPDRSGSAARPSVAPRWSAAAVIASNSS